MKKIIPTLIIIPILFTSIRVFAQNIPPDPFRIATPKEILLHDNPYEILLDQVEKNICDSTWEIRKPPFLLKTKPDDEMVIINYLRGVGDIPVFGNGERFSIEAKYESSLWKSTIAEDKIQTDAFVTRNANISKIYATDKKEFAIIKSQNDQYSKKMSHHTLKFAVISLGLNQSWMDAKGIQIKTIAVPGIQQAFIGKVLPSEDELDTTYRVDLYIGNWPKSSHTDMLHFNFIKNNSGEPIIENMTIYIITYKYNDMMKVIHSVDWTKLEALIKK